MNIDAKKVFSWDYCQYKELFRSTLVFYRLFDANENIFQGFNLIDRKKKTIMLTNVIF